jgi:hypothetical protein
MIVDIDVFTRARLCLCVTCLQSLGATYLTRIDFPDQALSP